jgi:hypothetical protein
VPANRNGVSAVAYDGGVALHVIEKGTYCGDMPNAQCRGALYEVKDWQMKQVAANVEGAKLIYYEPGTKALLQSTWGDGGCRSAKFFVYDFVLATSTMTFNKDNCDEATYDAYITSVAEYLATFGLKP